MEKQNDTPVKNPEDAATVGMFLKYTRLNQKKTLDSVSKTLCIRKIYIKAIEDSNFEELPPVPYGIGFVRSYAEYLGEDSSQIARMYKAETDAKFNGENKMYVLEPQEEATVPSKKYLLISLLAIMIIYFLWLAFNNYHNNASAPEVEPTNVETSADVNAEFPLVVEDYAPVEEAVAEPESETMLVSESQENNTSNEII